VQELNVPGFVGFYTQILQVKDAKLQLAFHNFRTSNADHSQTFKDLAILELDLKVLSR